MNGFARILNDKPIEHVDQAAFGFDIYSRALTSVVLDSISPIAIGIFGGWGTGKTSLMRLMYNELDSSEYARIALPIWFNAWRYESESHFIWPLINTIKEEISLRQPSATRVQRFVRFLDTFIRASSYGMEASIDVSPFTFKYSVKESINRAKELAKETGAQQASPYYDAFRYFGRAMGLLRG